MKTDELARLFGVGETTIRALVRRGVIERARRGEFDGDECVRRYCAHLRLTARSGPVAAELAKAKLGVLEARRRRLERADRREAGELIGLDARRPTLMRFVTRCLLQNPGMLAHLLDETPVLRLETNRTAMLPAAGKELA
jgi:hypothetical protein